MNRSRTFISALVLGFALIVPCISHAGFYDGNTLKQWSDAYGRTDSGNTRPADYQSAAYLTGYVSGVVDIADGIAFCLPDNVKLGQLVGIVRKYVRENPGKWNLLASTLVTNALSHVFPCKK